MYLNVSCKVMILMVDLSNFIIIIVIIIIILILYTASL